MLGRKRPFNQLKKALPPRVTRSQQQSARDGTGFEDEQIGDALLEHNNLKLSASKRAKTERYERNRQAEANGTDRNGSGIFTQIFESPFVAIKRMWSSMCSSEDSEDCTSNAS